MLLQRRYEIETRNLRRDFYFARFCSFSKTLFLHHHLFLLKDVLNRTWKREGRDKSAVLFVACEPTAKWEKKKRFFSSQHDDDVWKWRNENVNFFLKTNLFDRKIEGKKKIAHELMMWKKIELNLKGNKKIKFSKIEIKKFLKIEKFKFKNWIFYQQFCNFLI